MTGDQKLRLGTRSSLLAVAQSRLVKAALEQRHPGLAIELVCSDTRGDRDRSTPLTAVSDPDFFSAELDRALLDGEVDFCVHSYKDLDRARPAGIVTAALPEREQPHDVVLFRDDIETRIGAGRRLRIGSSSLRRQINVRDFLPAALPGGIAPTQIEIVALRGPVHERVQRIAAAADEPLDGVVLALAGLNRLWQDPDGRAAIEPALRQARRMVLPLGECPVASGQGALAIECREDDSATREILATLHHEPTAALLAVEQQLLDKHADEAPAGFGATAVPHPVLGYAAFLRGRSTRTAAATRKCILSGQRGSTPEHGAAWPGTDWSRCLNFEELPCDIPSETPVFVAHWRALRAPLPGRSRCWTSGVMSWKKLAEQGTWVEGCADNLGFAAIKPLLLSPALDLPELTTWTALTHADALDSWRDSGIGSIQATYRSTVDSESLADFGKGLSAYRNFYWSSSLQFERLRPFLPEQARHACGAGKTLDALRKAGVENVQAFVCREEWSQWLD